MTTLQGKSILVTGASSGIGRAICLAAANAGATVWATGRNASRLNDTWQLLPNATANHQIISADLCSATDLAALVAQLPLLHGVVHAAGMVKPLPIKYITSKHIDELMGINYTAPVLLTAQLFKQRKIANAASLVFISSISSQHPYMGGGLYASSKAALEAFCRTVAVEHASQKIRANCLLPALVDTPILEQMQQALPPDEFKRVVQNYPLGLGNTNDIAQAALFFLSDDSRWITGSNLKMDGGLTLYK